MPREIDCPDCGGNEIILTCTNCSHHRLTGFGGGQSICSIGRVMDSRISIGNEKIKFECSSYNKTKKYISEHNKCPSCKDGKITVYTQEELEKAVQEEREVIESIICDIDIDVIG